MSRSRKKNPILTDVGIGKKNYSHRVVRTEVKKILSSNKEYDEMLFPTQKAIELVNQYDICDHIWRLDLAPLVWHSWTTGEQIIEETTAQDILRYYRK